MKITESTRRPALGVVAASAILGLAGPELAGSHGPDLSGETVEFVIPYSESGGSARGANFSVPLLSEALPENPIVVVHRPAPGPPRAPTGSRNRAPPTVR